jgi:ABC-type multidrug transport system fused ATPase/permease subunit
MKQQLLKFLYVLPASNSQLLYLFLLFIMASGIETFGIGLIGPFLQLANNPSLISKNSFLVSAYQYLDVQSQNQFVALVGLFIIAVFIFKTFVSWRVKIYVFRFSFAQRGELARRLIRAYLDAPYTFHLSTSSSYIIQNISSDTAGFSSNFLMNLLNLTSNFFVIIFLVILLGVTNFVAVAIILGMMLPLFLIFHLLRKKIREWGKQTSRSNQAIIRSVGDSMGGIKETKVFNCGSYFEEKIIKIIDVYENAAASLFEVKLIPRMLIETVMIVYIIGFTSSFLLVNANVQQLTSELGVFAIASIRLMPAITQLLTGLTTLKGSGYVLDKLYSDLKNLEAIETEKSSPHNGFGTLDSRSIKPILSKVLYSPSDYETLKTNTQVSVSSPQARESLPSLHESISLKNVTYRYPKMERDAVHTVNLTIQKGESIAIIGRSGSGKTTLVDVILGLLKPDSGDIELDGRSIYSNLPAWQNLIGYIPQSIFLTGDSIERNIAFGVPDHLIDPNKMETAIQSAQLEHLIQELPQGIKTEVGERGIRLSGGQRQRIGIARALYHSREILVLDEATSALDNETEELVTESIKSLSGSMTMIIIAHRLSTVAHCDRVYQMESGQIVQAGTYDEVVIQGNLL